MRACPGRKPEVSTSTTTQPAPVSFAGRPQVWLTFRGWHGAPTSPDRWPACRLPKMPEMVTTRGRVALAAGAGARWASRVTGRGAGAVIGGLVGVALGKAVLRQLASGRRTVIVTGTNGKSTTTRMTSAALATLGPVATNAEGANMDAGLVPAVAANRRAPRAALEVDEMHVPHVADAVEPSVVVLLNLSRDQLDRVGEINHIERTLRGGLARHPATVVVANCDDVLMTSGGYESPAVVWGG